MGVILAHAFAVLEQRPRRRPARRSRPACSAPPAHTASARASARARGVLSRARGSSRAKSLDVLVLRRERGGREIGERRERPVILPPLGVGGLDDAAHDDLDFAMRLLDGEQVRDVAVRVDLLEPPPGRGDGPGERPLSSGRAAASGAGSARCT